MTDCSDGGERIALRWSEGWNLRDFACTDTEEHVS